MAGHRKRSVQLWLPLLPAAVASLLLALMVWSVDRVVGDELSVRAQQRVEQTAAVYSDRLSRVLARHTAELRLLALLPGLQDTPEVLRTHMNRLRESSPGYVWIGGTDAQGLVKAASDGLLEGDSIAQRPVFQQGQSRLWFGSLHPAVALVAPLQAAGRAVPAQLADIALPYPGRDGQPGGVLAAHLDAAFYDALREEVLGPRPNRRGLQMELASLGGQRLLGERAPLSAPQWDALVGAAPGTAQVFETEERGPILLVRHLIDRGTLPLATEWQVVAWQPLDQALAPARALERYVLVWGGVTVLLVSLIGFWLSRRLARPYSQLLDAVAERMGPQHEAAPGALLRVIAEQLRRLPARAASPGEQTLAQVLHDASRLRAVLEHLPSPVYLLDMGLRVLYWNAATERVFGWSAAEAEGLHVDQIFRDKDPGASTRLALRADMLRGGAGPWIFEGHQLRRDGTDIWGEWRITKVFGADGIPLGLLVQVRDLTAERALREQGEVLAAIINAASDAVIGVDMSGRVTLFNPAAARIFGRSAESMVGQSLDPLLPALHRQGHLELMQRFAGSRVNTRPMGFGRVRGQRADGTELELEASISHINVRGQKLLTAILRDVSERVRAEQALARYQLELSELTQRLLHQEQQSTREMAQTLHDQLGQTLGAIRLSYDALLHSTQSLMPPRALQRARTVAQQIEQAVTEVRQALVRLRPPLLEDFGLCAALDNEVRQRSAEADPVSLHVRTIGEAGLQRWPEDVEYAAFMVAREALANALQHAQASHIVLRVEGDAGHLRLDIIDDGVGLPDELSFGRPGHLGMVGMRERALAIGARLNARQRAERGTRITLIWAERADSAFGQRELGREPEG